MILDKKILMVLLGILLSCGCSKLKESITVKEGKFPDAKEVISPRIVFGDDFNEGKLNNKWVITRKGDFNESIIDVYDVDHDEEVDYRLRLRANTIGTADDTVKYHGVRSTRKIDFTEEKQIFFDIDWNNQRNGCYLTASVYLCPIATTGNPGEEKDWLKFEYVGVPPGHNARCVIATKINGYMKQLYTEGWPEDRSGRDIANQHIIIILNNETFKIFENGKEMYSSSPHNLGFTSAYLYLQMSSHSNYPSREIYFDNIVIIEHTHSLDMERNNGKIAGFILPFLCPSYLP